METKVNSNVIAKSVVSVLGVMHFMAQTSADLLIEAEAKIVGGDKDSVRDNRLLETYRRQEKVLNKVSELKAAIERAKQQVSTEIQ